MGKQAYTDLKTILDNYDDMTNATVKELFQVLKEDCVTYSDVKYKINALVRELAWGAATGENKERRMNLIGEVNAFLEKEKDNLKISDCL